MSDGVVFVSGRKIRVKPHMIRIDGLWHCAMELRIVKRDGSRIVIDYHEWSELGTSPDPRMAYRQWQEKS